VGRTEVKRPLGRQRRRWDDNIKVDLQDVGCGYGLGWLGSGYGQVASSCQCCDEYSGSIKWEKFLNKLWTY